MNLVELEVMNRTVPREPKITIVTATYNTKKFLNLCLNSVKQQTYRNIEHIFVDGYSTDGCVEIIKHYIKENPDIQTQFIQSKPKGIANALNIALTHATGDIIHFLHSDDFYINENSLERVVNYFDRNPKYEWLIGNGVLMFKDNIVILPLSKILKHLLTQIMGIRNFISHENTFASVNFYKKYGPFLEENKITIEYNIWLNALKETRPLIVDDNFTVFIVHPGSTSSNVLNWIKSDAFEYPDCFLILPF